MAKQTMNFTLDKSVVEGLRTIAKLQDRPMSRIVNKTLATYIAGLEQAEKETTA